MDDQKHPHRGHPSYCGKLDLPEAGRWLIGLCRNFGPEKRRSPTLQADACAQLWDSLSPAGILTLAGPSDEQRPACCFWSQ